MEFDASLWQGFLSALDPAERRELVEAGHVVELVPAQVVGSGVVTRSLMLRLRSQFDVVSPRRRSGRFSSQSKRSSSSGSC